MAKAGSHRCIQSRDLPDAVNATRGVSSSGEKELRECSINVAIVIEGMDLAEVDLIHSILRVYGSTLRSHSPKGVHLLEAEGLAGIVSVCCAEQRRAGSESTVIRHRRSARSAQTRWSRPDARTCANFALQFSITSRADPLSLRLTN